jgi:hypothetical protein
MDLFHWRSLTEAVRNIVMPGRVLIDKVFKRTRQFTSTTIDVDILEGNQKLAPFVSPIEGGVVVSKLGRKMNTITAPRIRLKVPLRASDFNERAIGAGIYVNEADKEMFKQQKIALEQQNLKDMVSRTQHWMCAQSLTGKIAVTQDNVAFEIDYLFPTANKPVLSGNFLWGGSESTILKNIRNWKRIGGNKGFNLSLAFSTPAATDELLADDEIKKLLDNRNISGSQLVIDGTDYIGRIAGVDIYEFSEEFVDKDGTSYPMLPDGTFTMLDPNARFDMNYAAAEDIEAGGNVITNFFSKTYIEKDPSVLWLLVEANVLPTVNQPGAVVHATVLE